MIQLTAKQQEGLNIAVDRYWNEEKCTVISGYAGTGKTTLVHYIIDALPVDEDDVVYATYTGKAAQVLAKKGNKNVSTLHKLLYESYLRPDGTFYRQIKKNIDYHIVVVDEVSMAPKTLMDLLFSHDCYVICLGDPFQLPPIDKNEDNHLLDHPDVFLDEIIRQEAESDIIKLTMAIREGTSIESLSFNGDQVQILPKESLSTGMLLWADEILVATNKTRKMLNDQMRQLKGMTSEKPQEGDKVICTRNYWGTLSNEQNDLINGTIGYLHNKFDTKNYLPSYVGGGAIDITRADLVMEDGESYHDLSMDTNMIITGDKTLDNKIAYRLSKNPRTMHLIPYEFVYGYAITGHRAQGSEWDKVLVVEENFPFNSEEHARWLYTVCTRASSKLVLLR